MFGDTKGERVSYCTRGFNPLVNQEREGLCPARAWVGPLALSWSTLFERQRRGLNEPGGNAPRRVHDRGEISLSNPGLGRFSFPLDASNIPACDEMKK